MPSPRTVRAHGYDVILGDQGDGPDGAVLVHGIGVSARYFRPLVAELAQHMRVLTPDLPGFGRSPDPDHALSIEQHAQVIGDLVERSGLTRPVLVGHSMGAQVVAELAATRPGLAQRVVLLGPVAEPGARSALRQGWRLVRDYRLEPAAANLITITDWLRCGPWRYRATVPEMLAYRLEDHLGAVTDPVILVRGERDPVAPLDYLELLAERTPQATIVEVPGEGHIAMYRKPREVADVCRGALLP